MSQKFDHINASEPVSTVTKHIKIYSDNPIHDCIDRIITACEWIDNPDLDSEYGINELSEVAEELFMLAYKESIFRTLQRIYHLPRKNGH